MNKELRLIESKDFRQEFINEVGVLEKVKELILLSDTEIATVKQVADYYEVGIEAINSIVKRNGDELDEDGYKLFTGKEIKAILVKFNLDITNHRGYFTSDGQRFANRSNGLFTKRAILRVGMLLEESKVAKEVRSRLLDIVHDIQESSPEIIENITNEIDEEKQLIIEKAEAEFNGNFAQVSIITAKLFALKNKRIKELEITNENIRSHSLTIKESRDVINRIVKTIGARKYGGLFGKAYGDLYSKINYKLGINIRARKRIGNETYLNTLTKEETFKVEQIVRCWASELGLDLDGLLKIA